MSAVTGNLNTIQDSGVQCKNRTDPSAASYLYVQLNEVLMHLGGPSSRRCNFMLAGSRVSCIGVIMATVPVLSSRGLDHDSVFKSGELFPARPRTFVQVGSPARVLEARHCQCDGWNF